MRCFQAQIFLMAVTFLNFGQLTQSFAMGAIYCLKPTSLGRHLRLQFELPDANQLNGHVHYEKSTTSIAIQKVQERELKRNLGRGSRTETVWQELPKDKSSGKYVVVSEGVQIIALDFVRSKDQKITHFKMDMNAVGDANCEWASDEK